MSQQGFYDAQEREHLGNHRAEYSQDLKIEAAALEVTEGIQIWTRQLSRCRLDGPSHRRPKPANFFCSP